MALNGFILKTIHTLQFKVLLKLFILKEFQECNPTEFIMASNSNSYDLDGGVDWTIHELRIKQVTFLLYML